MTVLLATWSFSAGVVAHLWENQGDLQQLEVLRRSPADFVVESAL